MSRMRLRELGITVGTMPTGPLNAITDVHGVWVGHTTLIYDTPRIARTGVTVIVPREGAIWQNKAFAGYHSFNGNGEMTGIPWLTESGMLGSPIAITNTHQVGVVRDALVSYEVARDDSQRFYLPVVAETYDGGLNDINAFHLTQQHTLDALAAARPGPVAEGNVGGGTGMICHEFKGGIGTSSRIVECPSGRYTVGVLVQANYGTDGCCASTACRSGGKSTRAIPLLPRANPSRTARSSSSWPPMRRSSRCSASALRGEPRWGSRGPAAWATTAAATCSWPSPPATIFPPMPMGPFDCRCCRTTT